MFEPGNASAVHNHPTSEEIDIILCGSGVLVDGDEKVPFKAGKWMFIPTAFSISTNILGMNHFGQFGFIYHLVNCLSNNP